MLTTVQTTRIVSGSHLFDKNSSDTFLHISLTDFISSIRGPQDGLLLDLATAVLAFRWSKNIKMSLLRYVYLSAYFCFFSYFWNPG